MRDNNGKIAISKNYYNKKTINNYNLKGKDAILLFDKYIDTSKPIIISLGNSNELIFSIKQLDSGVIFAPLSMMVRDNRKDSFFYFKKIKGRIDFPCTINGFDNKYIAHIVHNKLILSKSDYHLYVSDRYFELFDDYYIPVLQIELIKDKNEIYIGGAFNRSDGYVLLTKRGMLMRNFRKPTLLLPPQERDSLFKEYLDSAKAIKPIHE